MILNIQNIIQGQIIVYFFFLFLISIDILLTWINWKARVGEGRGKEMNPIWKWFDERDLYELGHLIPSLIVFSIGFVCVILNFRILLGLLVGALVVNLLNDYNSLLNIRYCETCNNFQECEEFNESNCVRNFEIIEDNSFRFLYWAIFLSGFVSASIYLIFNPLTAGTIFEAIGILILLIVPLLSIFFLIQKRDKFFLLEKSELRNQDSSSKKGVRRIPWEKIEKVAWPIIIIISFFIGSILLNSLVGGVFITIIIVLATLPLYLYFKGVSKEMLALYFSLISVGIGTIAIQTDRPLVGSPRVEEKTTKSQIKGELIWFENTFHLGIDSMPQVSYSKNSTIRFEFTNPFIVTSSYEITLPKNYDKFSIEWHNLSYPLVEENIAQVKPRSIFRPPRNSSLLYRCSVPKKELPVEREKQVSRVIENKYILLKVVLTGPQGLDIHPYWSYFDFTPVVENGFSGLMAIQSPYRNVLLPSFVKVSENISENENRKLRLPFGLNFESPNNRAVARLKIPLKGNIAEMEKELKMKFTISLMEE
ncbi:hypothetical protein AKJ64_00580 [candidate division MSBL1 archaeon SCGC-AAA259E17]|uniref:Uncharacterized protein n=1 Tax=candidate division MSBL1 archaeon SCGC-AAA259E17 TaxID=1698263 RepID=A0A133UGU0_9EURY|nr:hypothetical protein AKJ64_00580 [candidate division MSBL1 archaeon SCGC-AAA259E17]